MDLKELDINVITQIINKQIEQVSCLECCSYYVAPTSAPCGHMILCHRCWPGRRKCLTCGSLISRKDLQLNLPLQKLTKDIQSLVDGLEKLLNIKFDELYDEPNIEAKGDSNENVKDWLANSQNHFSAPVSSQNTQDFNPPVEYLTTKVQIHSKNVKIKSPTKITCVPIQQDDWDKISPMEEVAAKDQLDIVEPMQIEPLGKDDTACSTENLRRSARNKVLTNNSTKESNDIENEKNSTKLTNVSLKPSKKMNQTWNSVKRMKKEFSKLNKESRSKLNVSIEMCKKAQKSKHNEKLTPIKQLDKEKPTPDIVMDDTPTFSQTEKEIEQQILNEQSDSLNAIQKQQNSKPTIFVDTQEPIQKNHIMDHTQRQHNRDESTVYSEDRCSDKEKEKPKIQFFKKAALQTNTKDFFHTNDIAPNDDDIQISIKIGNTLTNICIRRKDNDVHVKLNSDRGIQTSCGTQNIPEDNITCSNNIPAKSQNIEISLGKSAPVHKGTQTETQNANKTIFGRVENKSTVTKKSTASADTKIGQFEITESVEKELSDIMECGENTNVINSRKNLNKVVSAENQLLQGSSQKENIPEDIINDIDMFGGESSSAPVQSLNSIKKVSSRILVPSQNRNSKRKHIENVGEGLNNSNNLNKKAKVSGKEPNLDIELENSKPNINSKLSINDSECQNYDLVIDKIFANIDKDIETIHKDVNLSKDRITGENINKTQIGTKNKSDENDQKYSENIFSIMDTDDSLINSKKNSEVVKPALESFTPVLDEDIETGNAEIMEVGTPVEENYDSDKSVVEETPQKNVSIPKVKQKSATGFEMEGYVNTRRRAASISRQGAKNVVNITDSVSDCNKTTKENTVIEVDSRPTSETPLNISNFVDRIKHNSTPVARKSLNFNRRNEEDKDQTLCPSLIAVEKTTQEKEFMKDIFNESAGSPMYKKTMRSHMRNKLCIAGSCLTPIESAKLKALCKERGWTYSEKYTKELTHLVVGVDDENKAQRSVKYMCALAAGKWIISFLWVDKCLQSETILPEEQFEALDTHGEPGPRRSRLAKRKLFEGFTFYCMGPFTILDRPTLKDILEGAGGRVVEDPKDIRVKDEKPAMLLAEPEHTQEDNRFTYMAMDLGVVPVNYEWVLDSLGKYTLKPILDLLLCPYSILPPATASWPAELIAKDFD